MSALRAGATRVTALRRAASGDVLTVEDLGDLRYPTEAAFQRAVVAEYRRRGLLCGFVPDWLHRLAMASLRRQRRGDREWPDPGMPDLIVPDPTEGVLRLIELKLDHGRLSPVQRRWEAATRGCERVEYRVVRPRDWEAE